MDQKLIETLRKLITNLKFKTPNTDLYFTHFNRYNGDGYINYDLKLSIIGKYPQPNLNIGYYRIEHHKTYYITYYPDHLNITDNQQSLEIPYADPNLENKLKEYFRNYLSTLVSGLSEISNACSGWIK